MSGTGTQAFLREMTIHHMAAVRMSRQLLARGLATHPQVARLARTIRDQQHAEIFRMQRWFSPSSAAGPRERHFRGARVR